jgi:hypothetical protein
LKQKVRKSRKLASRVVRLCEQQLSQGGHVGWEWPRGNLGWFHPEVKRFFDSLNAEGLLHVAKLDGCQVDVRSVDTGELMKKPWTIKTTSSGLKRALHLTCDGSHEHAECLGHGRAKASAFYPKAMCRFHELFWKILMVGLLGLENMNMKPPWGCPRTCHMLFLGLMRPHHFQFELRKR